MEKQFRVMAAASALMLAVCFCATAASAGISGDVNNDGRLDASDASMLRDALLGKGSVSADADMNQDRSIDGRDLTIVKQNILNPKTDPQPSGIPDLGTEPKLPATMYSNFRSGDPGDFFASDGWTNGSVFDNWWYEKNTGIQDGYMYLTIDQDWDNHRNDADKRNYSGGEYRTDKYYSYGYYECSMQAIKNPGVVSSFFTYTGPSDVINEVKNPWDEIDIEILGKDTTKMQINYYHNGQGGHEQMINLGFDASEGFHTYGFNWQPDKITWYVDGREVGSMSGEMPKVASKIMMNAWPGVGYRDEKNNTLQWLEQYDGKTPLTARYQWVTYQKADNADDPHTLKELDEIAKQNQQTNPQQPDPQQPDNNYGMNTNATMQAKFFAGEAGDFFASDGWTNGSVFDNWWYKRNAEIKNNLLELRIDQDWDNHKYDSDKRNYSGGEFRTNNFYHYGYYETSMKAIKNDGVVSSFFTYTGPSDVVNGQKNPWDEIDIEILGKDTTKVQLNYYRNSVGGHEYMVDLGFDSSQDFHIYGFNWQPDHITWYVDGKEVHTMWGDVPKTPSKIMMNAWPGVGYRDEKTNTLDWLKAYDGKTPLTAYYRWATYNQQ